MIKKINSKNFNFSFFLGGRQKVNSLEEGARKFGGATKFENGIYSNIPGNEYITLNESNNTISLFVPSTIDVNKKADNTEQVNYCIRQLKRYYNNANITFYDTKGSWFSEDLQKVVIEDITIISLNIATITEQDINIFVNLAEYIKQSMNQEGVSIAINTALAIV